ncbi:hypothetical protein MTR_8g086170 [Medicago truncatula]|uniref:Uncharacterized protein n=1 Tax=Medicago truncatula TaxID=3880 RepID=G7LIR2_MEDTR|nr:hypothetical protein MTR_8g086170 [Medicago truncatula]
MGSFVHGSWIWDLFEWKRPLFEDLIAKLEEERVSTCEDKWIWVHGQCGVFSLKSLYVALKPHARRYKCNLNASFSSALNHVGIDICIQVDQRASLLGKT